MVGSGIQWTFTVREHLDARYLVFTNYMLHVSGTGVL